MHKLPANHVEIDRPAPASIKRHIATSIAATKKAWRSSPGLKPKVVRIAVNCGAS
jgi:hypothetical protein